MSDHGGVLLWEYPPWGAKLMSIQWCGIKKCNMHHNWYALKILVHGMFNLRIDYEYNVTAGTISIKFCLTCVSWVLLQVHGACITTHNSWQIASSIRHIVAGRIFRKICPCSTSLTFIQLYLYLFKCSVSHRDKVNHMWNLIYTVNYWVSQGLIWISPFKRYRNCHLPFVLKFK